MSVAKEASVLVVDDNEDNRDMLSRRLKKQGYSVAVAEDGHKALEMIGEEKFDLILLDIMMPGISGMEVLKKLRENFTVADLPVIMATAKDQSEDIVAALKLGANDYVTKPLDFPVVLARVQTQLALKRLSKLKDDFLRIASHDLKNPLTVVLGTVKMVQRHVPPGSTMTPEAHELLSKITKRSVEMQNIIEDFLDFQALQDGRFSLNKAAVSLNDIAHDAKDSNYEYAHSKDVELVLELNPELPQLKADYARLTQVVRNFVSNAIKFGPRGSRVVIRTKTDTDCVVLEVSDSGVGLTDEDMVKVFDQYAKLSNKPTGGEKSSGLGLSIAKQMVDLHGGKIGVYNNQGGGATFWFSLPL
ncbi:MAG TPA: response regulator [Acidobacteriota bacterium]|jgi:signal transduction histidine kinase|nr:response regulator [Acidobacteriota bacterium]